MYERFTYSGFMPEHTGDTITVHNGKAASADTRFLGPTDPYPLKDKKDIVASPETSEGLDRLIMSSRLPVAFNKDTKQFDRTIGGMASAVHQSRQNGHQEQTLWIGYIGDINEDQVEEPGGLETALKSVTEGDPYEFDMVPIPRNEYQSYYAEAANGFLWPAAHGMTNRFMKEKVTEPTPLYNRDGEKVGEHTFSQKYRSLSDEKIEQIWKSYDSVNNRFAEKAMEKVNPNTVVEIHDYHLLLAAEKMRAKGFEGKISFFLHIPFPHPNVWDQVPHAKDMAKALLACDVVGFQTENDKNNFAAFVEQELGIKTDSVENDEQGHSYLLAKTPERTARIEAFPISINPEDFQALAMEPDVIQQVEEIRKTYDGKQIFFTGGRLDYAKGMVESLAAYYKLLERVEHDPQAFQQLKDKMVFVLATPLSRTEIPAYQKYAHQIEQMLEMIYERFGEKEYEMLGGDGAKRLKQYKELTLEQKQKQPVVHIGALDQKGITAYFKAADVVVVASRKDGMNLVAKEAVAVASTIPLDENRTPVLLLSEGSGASHELTGALQFDTNVHSDNVLDTIKQMRANIDTLAEQLYRGATMSLIEKRVRLMENLDRLEANVIYLWARKRDEALYADHAAAA
jgi:trehalose 6-phosphate synthase